MVNKRISILGCGWLGMPLAIELTHKGYNIKGSTTTQSKLDQLKLNGIQPFLIDIDKKDIQFSNFLDADVLIIVIPSKRIENFKSLIVEIEKTNISKIIFISSTSVYPETNAVVTEETPTKNTPLSEIEQLFITNPKFQSIIIRFGGLFGYNRQPANFIKAGNPLKNPNGYINFIHRDDCIRIIEQIIVKDIWNDILNACSDSHPKRKEFYLKELKKIGTTTILLEEPSLNNYKIVSSQKLKTLLNFKFEYNNLMEY